MASEKQIGFITKLIHSKYVPEQAGPMLEAMPWDQLDNKQASAVIEKLMRQADLPDPTVPEVVALEARHGSNSSQGACDSCGHVVAPNAGFYYGPFPVGSRWKTHHKVGECSTAPAPTPVTVEEGWYVVGDDIYQVYTTRNGRLAGKRADEATGKMAYAPGAVVTAATGTKLTVAEAAAFGHRTGRCLICSRELTDPVSVEQGIGPVCITKI